MTESSPPCWQQYQRYRGEIEQAIDCRKWPIEWLDGEILNGSATVMADDKACIVVTLRRYPGGLMEVHGLVAAGTKVAVLGLIRQAEAWGRYHGANIASIASRRGWSRLLSDYAETQVTIEKDLQHGAQ